MEVLRNFNFKENIKFPFFLKIFTFILLIWVYYPQKDMFIPGQSLQTRNNLDEIVHVTFNRLLAKNEIKKNLYHDRTKDYTPYDIRNKKSNNTIHNKSTHSHSNSRASDDLDNYMKNYKSRYSNKKGLAKLDCYFEKKIFDKIDNINGLGEKWQKDNNSLKKKKIKKYGCYIMLLSLLPLLGLIYNMLFTFPGKSRLLPLTYSDCPKKIQPNPGKCGYCEIGFEHYSKYIGKTMTRINAIIFYYIIPITVISIIIYTFIKIVKYEALKAGKGKMNRKEYIAFCKELLKNKQHL